MGTTLVHLADVHLETVFPDVRGGAARRAALADAFERAVDLAIARGADALTIAGDLYEAERAGPQTARFLFGNRRGDIGWSEQEYGAELNRHKGPGHGVGEIRDSAACLGPRNSVHESENSEEYE